MPPEQSTSKSPETIKVLHIDFAKIWGGGQSQISTLIRESSELPLEHYLMTPKESKLLQKTRTKISAHTSIQRNTFLSVLSLINAKNFCRKHKIKIIHAHCGKSHTFAYWLKKLLLPDITLIVHRRIPAKIRSNYISKIKFTDPMVNHFITVSDYIRSVLITGGIHWDRISTVRSSKSPVNCDNGTKFLAREMLMRSPGLKPRGDFLIVSASRLVPDKGLFVLIEAFRQLYRSNPNSRLFIAGEGELESELKETAKSLIDDGAVVFLGFRKDIPNLLLGSDVFAIPSLSEGLGSTIVEAMMAKTAVIGSHVEGIPELINNNVTGLTVPPGDANALCAAFQTLHDQAETKLRLAETGNQWAKQNCNPKIMVSKTYAVYKNAIEIKR